MKKLKKVLKAVSKATLLVGLVVASTLSFAQNIQKTGEGTSLYLEKDGKRLVKDKFEKIGVYNSKADLIPAKLNGKWGFYNNNGKLIIPHQYSSLYCDNYLTCWYGMGFIKVDLNGKVTFIDKTGKEVQFPHEVFIDINTVPDACYYTVKGKDGKIALANDEKLLSPFIYDMIVKGSSSPLTFNAVKNNKTYVLDANGQEEGAVTLYNYRCDFCGQKETSNAEPNNRGCKVRPNHKWVKQ